MDNTVPSSEQAQTNENERVAHQKGKRNVVANVQLREDLLALLADTRVNSSDVMIFRLDALHLKLTLEFQKKDFNGMRVAIREEFLPTLNSINQEQADRIGHDIDLQQVAGDPQTSVESADTSLEPDPELLKQALSAMKMQHDKTDAELLEKSLGRDAGIGDIPFQKIHDAIMEQSGRGLKYRKAVCFLHSTNGPLTPVGRNDRGELCLLEGCEQSKEKRGDMMFNQGGANAINEPGCPNAIDTLYDNGAVMPSVDLLRRHLKSFSDHNKYDSSWAAPDNGMTREELAKCRFAAYICRYVGRTDNHEDYAHHHNPSRRCRGTLWVQIS